MTPELLDTVMALSPAEKWELIHFLWDLESDTAAAEPLSPDLIAELDRRMTRLAADPSTGASWDEVVRHAKSQVAQVAHAS